jgi:hypothetical protein
MYTARRSILYLQATVQNELPRTPISGSSVDEVLIRGILRSSQARSSKKLHQEFIGNSSPLANKAGMTETERGGN